MSAIDKIYAWFKQHRFVSGVLAGILICQTGLYGVGLNYAADLGSAIKYEIMPPEERSVVQKVGDNVKSGFCFVMPGC